MTELKIDLKITRIVKTELLHSDNCMLHTGINTKRIKYLNVNNCIILELE